MSSSASDPELRQSTETARVDEFMALFTRHSSWLRGYVLSLVLHAADADDVLQNTHSVLWRKFDQFEPGSDFFAWACQIARHQVMHYRRSKGRDRVRFNDELIELIADDAVAMADDLDHMRTVLAHCLKKLPEKDRQLIAARYREEGTAASVAKSLGRTVDAAYKALGRVRKVLLACIERNRDAKVLQ